MFDTCNIHNGGNFKTATNDLFNPIQHDDF